MLQNIVSGMNFDNHPCPTSSLLCEACMEDKQHRVAFPNEGEGGASEQAFGNHTFIHVWPMRTTSVGSARYCMTSINDFLKKMWLYAL